MYTHDSETSSTLVIPSVHYAATQQRHLACCPPRSPPISLPCANALHHLSRGLHTTLVVMPLRDSVVCQYCSRPGHIAIACWDLFPGLRFTRPSVNVVNFAAAAAASSKSWQLGKPGRPRTGPDIKGKKWPKEWVGPTRPLGLRVNLPDRV